MREGRQGARAGQGLRAKGWGPRCSKGSMWSSHVRQRERSPARGCPRVVDHTGVTVCLISTSCQLSALSFQPPDSSPQPLPLPSALVCVSPRDLGGLRRARWRHWPRIFRRASNVTATISSRSTSGGSIGCWAIHTRSAPSCAGPPPPADCACRWPSPPRGRRRWCSRTRGRGSRWSSGVSEAEALAPIPIGILEKIHEMERRARRDRRTSRSKHTLRAPRSRR